MKQKSCPGQWISDSQLLKITLKTLSSWGEVKESLSGLFCPLTELKSCSKTFWKHQNVGYAKYDQLLRDMTLLLDSAESWSMWNTEKLALQLDRNAPPGSWCGSWSLWCQIPVHSQSLPLSSRESHSSQRFPGPLSPEQTDLADLEEKAAGVCKTRKGCEESWQKAQHLEEFTSLFECLKLLQTPALKHLAAILQFQSRPAKPTF